MEKERAWMPITAGILDIIAGVYLLSGGLFLVVLISRVLISPQVGAQCLVFMPSPLLEIAAALLIILGVLAIVGGLYGLQRKLWGLAIIGSVCATVFSPLLGIPAIIFTALSKQDFQQQF